MAARILSRFSLLLILTCFGAIPRTAVASVDMILTPSNQSRAVGQFVDVTLSIQANGPVAEQSSGLDAILQWDPTKLDFVSADTSVAGYPWFVAGFLPNPDGLNTTLTDGDGMYTVLASPGSPALAPTAPGVLVVVKFRFLALAASSGTVVELLPSFGSFSRTRVLGSTAGSEITGDISSTATVKIIAPCSPTVGDVDGNTVIDAADIPAAVDVYLGFDTNPAHIIAADANCDGLANGDDIQLFIEYVYLWL